MKVLGMMHRSDATADPCGMLFCRRPVLRLSLNRCKKTSEVLFVEYVANKTEQLEETTAEVAHVQSERC